MSDFPAAHSMDTTWFAIDEDGYNSLVQPIEHLSCDVWDKKRGWVDTDNIFREIFPLYP